MEEEKKRLEEGTENKGDTSEKRGSGELTVRQEGVRSGDGQDAFLDNAPQRPASAGRASGFSARKMGAEVPGRFWAEVRGRFWRLWRFWEEDRREEIRHRRYESSIALHGARSPWRCLCGFVEEAAQHFR